MIIRPTIAECEAAVTTNILLDHLGTSSSYPYIKALASSVYALNDYFKRIGIDSELFCDRRGRRAYIFHRPTNRLMAEYAIITDETQSSSLRKNLRIAILDKHGNRPCETVGDLAVQATALGPSKYDRRGRRLRTDERRK